MPDDVKKARKSPEFGDSGSPVSCLIYHVPLKKAGCSSREFECGERLIDLCARMF